MSDVLLADEVSEAREFNQALESQELLDWLFHSIGDREVVAGSAPSIGAWSWLCHLRGNDKASEAFYNKYLDHTMKRAMADKVRAQDGGAGEKEKVLVDEAGIERMIELCQTAKK